MLAPKKQMFKLIHRQNTDSILITKYHWLVVSTHLKNILVKLDHFPRDRGEHKKYLKPPARSVSQILSTSNPTFSPKTPGGDHHHSRRIRKRALRFALRHPNHQSHRAKCHSNSHTSLRELRRKK